MATAAPMGWLNVNAPATPAAANATTAIVHASRLRRAIPMARAPSAKAAVSASSGSRSAGSIGSHATIAAKAWPRPSATSAARTPPRARIPTGRSHATTWNGLSVGRRLTVDARLAVDARLIVVARRAAGT